MAASQRQVGGFPTKTSSVKTSMKKSGKAASKKLVVSSKGNPTRDSRSWVNSTKP